MISRTAFKARICTKQTRLSRRISNHHSEVTQYPPIKYFRPVAWSAAAITGIYVLTAAWELAGEIEQYENEKQKNPQYWSRPMSFGLLERVRLVQASTELKRRQQADISIYSLTSMQAVRTAWTTLTSTEKAAWTVIGMNTALFLTSNYIPAITYATAHLPIANRNWTLLTSTFGHAGSLHLLVNMWFLSQFTLPVSRSKNFQGSAPHATAFYLSTGILSCLAYHLQSAFKPSYRMIPCLGASGALYGLLGVFGMSYPDSRLGIILLPFSLPAQQALSGLALFELYGTIFGTALRLAHVSHLTGLAAGVGYVYFDAGVNVWTRLKLFLYNTRYNQQNSRKR